jgi:nicotinate-nucleotide pyrophosphorylase (carboxylating)
MKNNPSHYHGEISMKHSSGVEINLTQEIVACIQRALDEDIGSGDVTTNSIVPSEKTMTSQIIAKQAGIIAGLDVSRAAFKLLDEQVDFTSLVTDGQKVENQQVLVKISGPARSILTGERTALNFLGRMSGIATLTRQFVDAVAGTKAVILDTRKTAPGLRPVDKLAVKLGGGQNHRIGLYDMILIKDNHIDFAGGIENAINAVKDYLKRKNKNLKIEVEARSLDDIQKIMEIGGIHRIMLDNFDVKTTQKAVKMIQGKYETESSGGITLDTLRDYAKCGVDYISVGALTHQIRSLDMSLKAVK